ncbi:hypothetical protein KAM481_42270 [Aeromonas caviae]|nr:hypothetical protein KAM481_42270 [Aeromonas caviae]
MSEVFNNILNTLIEIHKKTPFTMKEWFSLFLGNKDCYLLITAASGYKQNDFEKMLPDNHRAVRLSLIKKAIKDKSPANLLIEG